MADQAVQKKARDASGNHTALLAERLAEVAFESLDKATIDAVKRLIMDGIAVAVAGDHEEAPRLIAEHVRELACKETASVWGHGFRTAPQFAAFANAASMHVLDFEPMSNPPTHAVSPTLPVALALGEALQASGCEVIAACAKGFETQGRVLVASSHGRGELPFHTPGVVGLMGSTAAASHLLHLDAKQIVHAFGIATSRCSGLSANTGSMVKCTHCGNAAASGLEAALLAQRGFISNPNILDAPHGYVHTFFPKHFDFDVLLQFGQPYRCVDPGMAIKFFPSKYPTHFAIAAALDARPEIGDRARIRSVRLDTPEIDDADRPDPRSGLEGKFSFQYVTAAALLDGRIGIDTFTDERRFRADLVELLPKITVVRDPSRSRDTRNMYIAVEVTLDNGKVVKSVCDGPPGTWGKPVDPRAHRAKLNDCLGVRFKESDRSRLLDSLERFEWLSGREVRELMQLLA